MFDQLPGERGFDFVPTTTSLRFTVAPDLTLATIDGLPALPYDTVDAAMKAASMVAMPPVVGIEGVLTLQRKLGVVLKATGLGAELTPPAVLLDKSRHLQERTVHEFALVQSLPGRHRYVPLGCWSLDDRGKQARSRNRC